MALPWLLTIAFTLRLRGDSVATVEDLLQLLLCKMPGTQH